jgi:RNA polymerase sigma factor (sigma-70 family)
MVKQKSSKQHPNERELGKRFRQGDKAAFGALYLFYNEPVQLFVWKIPGVAHQVDKKDLVQNVAAAAFTNAWASHATFKPERASFSTWIHTIARNICTNTLRLRKKYAELSGEVSLDNPSLSSPLPSTSVLSGEDLGFTFKKGEKDYIPPTRTGKADRVYDDLLWRSFFREDPLAEAIWLIDEEDNPLKLSLREKKIVSEIQNLTPKEQIAKKFKISLKTLDTAISRIKKKISDYKR